MGTIKIQSVQGFWAQLQAQAFAVRDIFAASSYEIVTSGEAEGTVQPRSVATIIEKFSGVRGSIPTITQAAAVDLFLIYREASPTMFCGQEMIGHAYQCESTASVI